MAIKALGSQGTFLGDNSVLYLDRLGECRAALKCNYQNQSNHALEICVFHFMKTMERREEGRERKDRRGGKDRGREGIFPSPVGFGSCVSQ